MNIKNLFKSFTIFEWILWIGSVVIIIASFLIFGVTNWVEVVACVLGASGLIFIAKGHVIGQLVFIVFALAYAYVSFEYKYYGEMLTFLLMAMPINIVSVITWLKNQYKHGHGEVAVSHFGGWGWVVLAVTTIGVTVGFYFLLGWLGTNNLWVSTISVTTSFAAAFLMVVRSPYYAIAYAMNDLILIVLWTMASFEHIGYIPMVVNFSVFFINDIYGFVSWERMKHSQHKKNVDSAPKMD